MKRDPAKERGPSEREPAQPHPCQRLPSPGRPGPSANLTGFHHRGGGWVLAQSVLMLAALAAAPPTGAQGRSPAGEVAGWACCLSGAAAGLAGALALGRNRTMFPRPLADSALVTAGIYRWIRHPHYTSVLLLCVGWALLWRSWPALGLSALLAPFFVAKAAREERWLRERYPEYAEYARRTWRFVPWLF